MKNRFTILALMFILCVGAGAVANMTDSVTYSENSQNIVTKVDE